MFKNIDPDAGKEIRKLANKIIDQNNQILNICQEIAEQNARTQAALSKPIMITDIDLKKEEK